MEFWLLVVIGILLIIIFSLVIKLFFVHKTVREIEAQFTERLDVPQEGYLNKNFINIFEERQQVLILRYVKKYCGRNWRK